MALDDDGLAETTATAAIEAQLRRDIFDHVLEPGAVIHLDRLRNRFRVSLQPIRAAVARLVTEGLVENSGQRYRVTPISPDNFEELLALRLHLEPFAVRHAVIRGGIDWEANVLATHHRLSRIGPGTGTEAFHADWARANNAFHLALVEGCGMPTVLRMCRSVFSMGERYQYRYLREVGITRDLKRNLAAIADAAVGRRADETASLVARHLERGGARIRELMASEPDRRRR